jgi:hypothetical protein
VIEDALATEDPGALSGLLDAVPRFDPATRRARTDMRI